MKKEKFIELWNMYAPKWCDEATYIQDGATVNVSDFCVIKDDYGDVLYEKYEGIKKITKRLYFGDEQKRVNRFKRAAIIAYAINICSPLSYREGYVEDEVAIESMLLKQRLALYIAIQSIIMQYPENIVKPLYADGPIFDFNIVSKGVGDGNSDIFSECIYKDLFFSSIYQNFNVLTMICLQFSRKDHLN